MRSLIYYIYFLFRKFRVAHGYNLEVFTPLSYLGKSGFHLSMLSRFDALMNIAMTYEKAAANLFSGT